MGGFARLLAALPIVLAVSSAAFAEDAGAVYEELFGEEEARVGGTSDRKDDIAFARKLLEAGTSLADSPELRALILTKAHHYAMVDRAGWGIAIDAARQLAECSPEVQAYGRKRLLAVLEMCSQKGDGAEKAMAGEALLDEMLDQADEASGEELWTEVAVLIRKAERLARRLKSGRGGEVKAKRARAERLRSLAETRAGLLDRLAKDPEDPQARAALVRLLVLRADRPEQAVDLLDDPIDKTWKLLVPRAAKRIESLRAPDLEKLAAWYREHAVSEERGETRALWGRVAAYARAFLALHPEEDVSRLRIQGFLDEAGRAVRKLNGRVVREARRGQWIDFLTLVDPLRDGGQGAWTREGRTLDLQGTVWIPVVPAGSYEIEIVFERSGAADGPAVMVPVGPKKPLVVFSGWDNTTAGLNDIDGRDAPKNATKTAVRLRDGKRYRARVTVTVKEDRADIAATLDGLPLFSWNGPIASLSDRHAPDLEDLPGIAAKGARIRSLRFRMLSGAAKPAGSD